MIGNFLKMPSFAEVLVGYICANVWDFVKDSQKYLAVYSSSYTLKIFGIFEVS